MTTEKRLTREEFEILLGRFMHLETLKPVDLWNWIEQYADQKAREAQIEVLEEVRDRQLELLDGLEEVDPLDRALLITRVASIPGTKFQELKQQLR